MRQGDISSGQVWVWRNQSDGSEHSRRIVEVNSNRVRYVVDGEYEVAAPVEEFYAALVARHARLLSSQSRHSGAL